MIPRKETLQVEFKSDANKGVSDKALVEEVVAMSNAEGGDIYVGVEDDGRITGAKSSHCDIDGVKAMIANLTFPSVFVSAQILRTEGVQVLQITVPMSGQIVATSSGKTIQRRMRYDGAPEMVPFFPYEFASRSSYLLQADPSADTLFPYEEDWIDSHTIEVAKKNIRKIQSADKTLLDLDTNEFLGALKLLKNGIKERQLTLAGLLLFGKREYLEKFVPTHRYHFQFLRDGKVIINSTEHCNIIEAFQVFYDFCEKFNYPEEFTAKGVRYETKRFDEDSIREAFANASVHRDYSLHRPIQVLFDETGLTISNPGSLVHGLKSNQLIGALPKGRNPLLNESLKRIGFSEQTGRGVDRIYAGSARLGKVWPSYASSDIDSVTVYIPLSEIDAPFAYFIMENGSDLSLLGLLSLASIRLKGKGKASEIADSFGIDEEKEARYLRELSNKGLITKEGDFYYLRIDELSTVRKRKLSEEERIEAALAFGKDHDDLLTNSDVQLLLGIDKNASYRLLKKMERQGLLVLETTGKYARYRIKRG